MNYMGYRSLASDYLECALFLKAAVEGKTISLHFNVGGPILANLAHAQELVVKGHLLKLGLTMEDTTNLGHDLENGFLTLKRLAPTLAKKVEKDVRERWKVLLRTARDGYRDPLVNFGISDPALLEEFGVLSNATIGANLPEFWCDLKWLSDRHKHGGSLFRYFKGGVDQRSHIQAIGLNIFTVPVSVSWGTEILLNSLTI